MNRQLGIFESAQVLTGLHSPFNLVLVLRLNRGPVASVLESSLRLLSRRHPLLRAGIVQRRGSFCFTMPGASEIPLLIARRGADDSWRPLAEDQLNTGFDLASGPLLRLIYLAAAEADAPCELILTAHHVVIDGTSAARLLQDLLSLCQASAAGDDPAPFEALDLLPAAEDLFPAEFRNFRGALHQAGYAVRLALGELRCLYQNRGLDQPAIRPSAKCRVMPFQLSTGQTRQLLKRCRGQGITLNSLLCAAQLLVARRLDFQGAAVTLRHFVFADLRPYLKPPVTAESLGNYAAMLPLFTRVEGDAGLWDLARSLSEQIHLGSKRGDKYTSLRMSRLLMKTILKAQNQRMGHAALSFSGAVPLVENYGDISITGLHAFVSNLALGPVYTANARLFRNRLCWDMVYLDTDMSQAEAGRIAGELTECMVLAGQVSGS